MKDPRDFIMRRAKWIVGRECRCVAGGVGWRGNGVEASVDGVVRNTMKSVLWAMKGAASWRSVI